MSQSLFTSQTPATEAADGGAPGITTATTLTFDVAGTVSGIRFWAPSVAAPADFTCELWRVDSLNDGSPSGTLLASVVPSALTPNTWNNVLFSSPVAVNTSQPYRAAVNSHNATARRYVASSHFFGTTAIVNGDITGIQSLNPPFANLGNGVFADGVAPGNYPHTQFNETAYFIDVLFDVVSPGVTLSANLFANGSLSAGLVAEARLSAALTANGTLSVGMTAEARLAAALSVNGSLSVSLSVPSGPSDPIGTPVAEELLSCFTDQLQQLPSPPARIQLRVGQETGPLIGPNVDECCAGLAWIRIVSIYPSWDSFPAADNDWLPCGPLAYAVVLEMGVAFCMPWSDSDDSFENIDPPNAQDWATAFATQMQHQTLMRRAAACCWRPTQRRAVGEWSPLPVEGGCTGGKLLVTVSVMAPCSDC